MNYVQIVDICCRDLRRYLQNALANTKGGVITVKMRRLLRVELSPPDRARYSTCLSRVLHPYMWKSGTYIIPRQDVEKLLETFDELCQSVKQRRRREPKPRPPSRRHEREELVLTTLHLPPPLLHVLDEYAKERNMTRSAVIRYAIHLLISKYKTPREDVERAHEKPLARVSFHLPRDLLTALDEYAAALQTTRASVVRYAVARLLKRLEEATPTP
jgi:metal-responsive CopG/Arc/MetJ family transcriptional regulator